MEAKNEEIEVAMLQLATFANNPIAGAVRGHVLVLQTLNGNNPDNCVTLAVNALPLTQLRKLQDGFVSTNREDGRLKVLAKELFAPDYTDLATGQRVLKICENAINTMTTIAFYTEFMDEEGGFAWDRFRKMVNKAVEDKVDAMARAM